MSSRPATAPAPIRSSSSVTPSADRDDRVHVGDDRRAARAGLGDEREEAEEAERGAGDAEDDERDERGAGGHLRGRRRERRAA